MKNDFLALKPNSNGYPEWCRRIALSQGSGSGYTLSNPVAIPAIPIINQGGLMFDVKEYPGIIGSFFGPKPFREITTRWQSNGGNTNYAKVKAGWQFYVLGFPVSTNILFTENRNAVLPGWDHCPGSLQGLTSILHETLSKFPAIYPQLLNSIYSSNSSYFYAYDRALHSFAPTVGTFDLHDPTNNYQEENVYTNIKQKYDIYNIRKTNDTLVNEQFFRYGFPHLTYPNNHYQITPFDAICNVGDTSEDNYNTHLPNHFHVDAFQPDYLDFLLGELAPAPDLFLQKRIIQAYGNTPYRADFDAKRGIYSGKKVYQDYSDHWRDPEGDFIIQANTDVEMKAGQFVVLRPGFEAKAGSKFRAYIGMPSDCIINSPCASVRNLFFNTEDNTLIVEENKNEHIRDNENNFNFKAYPNPNNTGIITIEIENFDTESNYIFQLYNMMGNLIRSEKNTYGKYLLTLNTLPGGIYLLTCTDIKGNSKSVRIIYHE